jgi:hypothetical protein
VVLVALFVRVRRRTRVRAAAVLARACGPRAPVHRCCPPLAVEGSTRPALSGEAPLPLVVPAELRMMRV